MPCRSFIDEAWRGRRWVIETDITNCFSVIPHEELMEAVEEERVCDQAMLCSRQQAEATLARLGELLAEL